MKRRTFLKGAFGTLVGTFGANKLGIAAQYFVGEPNKRPWDCSNRLLCTENISIESSKSLSFNSEGTRMYTKLDTYYLQK